MIFVILGGHPLTADIRHLRWIGARLAGDGFRLESVNINDLVNCSESDSTRIRVDREANRQVVEGKRLSRS